jgi:hypothetical protein
MLPLFWRVSVCREARLKEAVSDKEAELRTYWGDKVAILEHEVTKHI